MTTEPSPRIFLVSPVRNIRSMFTTRNSPPVITPLNQNIDSAFTYRSPLKLVGIGRFSPLAEPPRFSLSDTGLDVPSTPPSSSLTTQYHEVNFQMPQEQPEETNIFLSQTALPTVGTISNLENFKSGTIISCHQNDQHIDTDYQEDRQNSFLKRQTMECNTQYSDSSDKLIILSNEEIFYEPTEVSYEVTVQTTEEMKQTYAIAETESSVVKESRKEMNECVFNGVIKPWATNDSSDRPSLHDDSPMLSGVPFSKSISLNSPSLNNHENKNKSTKIEISDDAEEEIVKAAKILFSKRTRTLYHWMFPNTSRSKMKETILTAWDTLSDAEKYFYKSQVLGRFSLKAPRLMVNPQLNGMKSLNSNSSNSSCKDGYTEAEEAVENLFNSCDDADNWISYPTRKRKHAGENNRKSKWIRSSSNETGARARLGCVDPEDVDEETAILRSMREDKLNNEFEDDMELNTELKKYCLISENGIYNKDDDGDDDEIWDNTLDVEDLLAQMGA